MNETEYKKKLEELFKASSLAKEILSKDYIEIELHGDEYSFHPNGKCGCIELDDDCFLVGIRCNHLMWCEGWTEGVELNFKSEKDAETFEGKAILFYGNHKGYISKYLICV